MHILSQIKAHQETIVKLLPLLAFAVPLALLYISNLSDPYLNVTTQSSFQLMWKGRTFQLFFIWLIALQYILTWDVIKTKVDWHNKMQLATMAVASALPTVYVVAEYFLGLNNAIASFSQQGGISFWYSMPLAVEYLAFSALFFFATYLVLGRKGVAVFALPGLFAALVGVIYTIDNAFPNGQFTPFQLLVPTTANFAEKVLNWMGYATSMTFQSGMPTLQASGPLGSVTFAIAWPCAGIESLLIFTAVCLLFLMQMHISWKAKVGFFVFGAVVTYFINVMRIVTIFTIGMQYGATSPQVQDFHFYYGPLYAISWIVSYPLIIMLGQGLWVKLKKKQQAEPKKPQPAQQAPA